MLTTRTRTGSAVLAAILLVWAGPAWAGGTHGLVVPGDGETPPPGTTITTPSDAGTGDTAWDGDIGVKTQPGPGGTNSSGGTSGGCTPVVPNPPGLPYSCAHACWYKDADLEVSYDGGTEWVETPSPQPSPDNPVGGHADGKYVECAYSAVGSVAIRLYRQEPWWIGPGGEVAVDPAQLAQQAVQQMGLRVPEIGMTGGSPPDGMQIVGIPAWLWAVDPGESTTPGVAGIEPIVRSASAGGVTVTATGRLDRIVWSLGDGATVTCSGAKAAGTPYEGRYDKQPSPTCGYTYTSTSAGQPNEAFTVTATAYWVVTWSGGNQSGTISVQRSRNIPKQVGELQALIIRPERKN